MWPFKKKETLLTETYVDPLMTLIRPESPYDRDSMGQMENSGEKVLRIWSVYGHNRVVLSTRFGGTPNEINYVYAEVKLWLTDHQSRCHVVWSRCTPKFWCHSLQGAKPMDFVRELWENEMAKIDSDKGRTR